jgi:hydrogenase nickel incorporation protein HypA/HybF
MHEFALAEALIARAAEAAAAGGLTSVTRVEVRIGELQDVDQDAFATGLEVLRAEEPALASAEFVFEPWPAELTCRRCGHRWPLAESRAALPPDEQEAVHLLPEVVHVYVTCPRCSSPDFEISGGRGVALAAITG